MLTLFETVAIGEHRVFREGGSQFFLGEGFFMPLDLCKKFRSTEGDLLGGNAECILVVVVAAIVICIGTTVPKPLSK